MDSDFRGERYSAPIIFNGVFARLPSFARHDRAACRWTGSGAAVCVLFAFSPLAIYYSAEGRMYSLLWLCVLATTWVSLVMQRGGGVVLFVLWILMSAAGFLTHYFFVFPMVGDCCISSRQAGKAQATSSGGMCARNGSANSAVVCQVA